MTPDYKALAKGMNNVVQCDHCGRTKSVVPAHCLEHGWPRCCGMTMSLAAKGTKAQEISWKDILKQMAKLPTEAPGSPLDVPPEVWKHPDYNPAYADLVARKCGFRGVNHMECLKDE